MKIVKIKIKKQSRGKNYRPHGLLVFRSDTLGYDDMKRISEEFRVMINNPMLVCMVPVDTIVNYYQL